MELPSKSRFPRAREVAYLDTAAEGLPLADAEKALASYYRDKSMGTPGRRRLYEMETQARDAAARLLGTPAENVVLLSSASEGLNLLANSICWRPGDEVLITDLEFPSNVLAWLRLRDRGVRVRVIPSEAGVVSYEQFVSQMNPATRLVSVSQVSYKTGAQVPFLSELAREAHRVGAVFSLDATQALGRVPVSVDGIDYLVASSYKWLLGVHGLGVVYLSPELRERVVPGTLGWYSVQNIFTPDRFERYEYKPGARRLASGMPNFPAMYALRESIEFLLEIGPERLEASLGPLVKKVRDGLQELGLELLTPPEPQFASGIVAFAHSQAARVGSLLEEEGVVVWAGDGRVRASVHLYNDEADITRYLSVLKSLFDRRKVSRA